MTDFYDAVDCPFLAWKYYLPGQINPTDNLSCLSVFFDDVLIPSVRNTYIYFFVKGSWEVQGVH